MNRMSVFKLNTVIYGTLHKLSYDEEQSFPVGSYIVRRDFYVDDLIN